VRRFRAIYFRSLTLGAILVGTLVACDHPTIGSATVSTSILRRGLSGEPSTLDPAAAADNYSFEVLRDLYEGLTAEAPSGAIVPGVASTWTVDSTGTQYTFQIRSDARWSNGAAIRAQDFVNAWRRVVDPKQASPVADNLRIIKGATAIISGNAPPDSLSVAAKNDKTLIVNLEQPAPYLPQLLTHSAAFPIFSAATAVTRNPSTWVSNGPFLLSSWSPGTELRLVKNDTYWDSHSVHIKQVQYQIAEENSQYIRFRAQQLDMTDTVPANVGRQTYTELSVAPYLATVYYGFNLSVSKLASDRKLRQALAMAIDRKRLVQTLGFGQKPAFGFVPPGVTEYISQSWDWENISDSVREREAKILYAQSGYTPEAPLRLRVLVNTNPTIKNTAIVIASMWKETLGVETNLQEEEYRVFLETRHDKSHWDIVRLGWTADYNDAGNFLDIFRSSSNNNDTNYKDRDYDDLLKAAARTPDAKLRGDILQEAEKLMLTNYPIIPLYFVVSKRLIKPNVRGFVANPLNRVPSKELSVGSK
jgi:oligopeptide transport system substrate-binding protein